MEQLNGAANLLPLRIRVGYGPDLLEYSDSQKFFVRFDSLQRLPLSPFEEAVIAAKQIAEQAGSKVTLCLSGGLDSEAMAMAFLRSGVSFDVTTLRFANDLNVNDIGRASEFCKKHNITQNFIDLDVVKFFEEKKYLNYVDPYFCPSPEIATQLWFAEQIKQPFVWGGEAFRMFVKDGMPSLQAVSEVEAVIYRFIEKKKLNAVPNFHFFTPELAWAFFNVSTHYKNKFFENDRLPLFYEEKLSFYRTCGFPLEANANRSLKLHGFESLKNYFDTQVFSGQGKTYNEYFRIPVIKKYPFQGQVFVDIPKTDKLAKNLLNLSVV